MTNFPRRLQLPNYPTLLQLDAKLNLGMSGGAVVNMRGELVGLTTMASQPVGIRRHGGLRHPHGPDRPAGRRDAQGRARRSSTACSASALELGSTNRVEEVTPNSPAAQGDLQTNDEILSVNDIPVTDFDTLILAINSFAPGDEVRLKIRRLGKEIERSRWCWRSIRSTAT